MNPSNKFGFQQIINLTCYYLILFLLKHYLLSLYWFQVSIHIEAMDHYVGSIPETSLCDQANTSSFFLKNLIRLSFCSTLIIVLMSTFLSSVVSRIDSNASIVWFS